MEQAMVVRVPGAQVGPSQQATFKRHSLANSFPLVERRSRLAARQTRRLVGAMAEALPKPVLAPTETTVGSLQQGAHKWASHSPQVPWWSRAGSSAAASIEY